MSLLKESFLCSSKLLKQGAWAQAKAQNRSIKTLNGFVSRPHQFMFIKKEKTGGRNMRLKMSADQCHQNRSSKRSSKGNRTEIIKLEGKLQ